MPPTSRRLDRTQATASASRSRMYNLGGHAHSSGSLLPRSTDVHAASTSAATSAAASAAARGVEATDAPYLTNLESHFGRVTLTAPDNLLRKQAKEKKQKIRQRKAQNAQAAAAALAGAIQNPLSSSVGRNAMSSSSNLLDSSRRYQTTLEDAPVSSGLLLSASGQHAGMRRAFSGNQTPTLTSTSHLQTPSPSTSQTVATRTRRRRPSASRQDSSRPASRASGTSRPESALSFNDDEPPQQQQTSASNRSQQPRDDRTSRSRTESAPASQPRRSHNAFATAPDDVETTNAASPPAPLSNAVPQTSLHRQNVWNDITEADPDDLPPPFPEGAPRPPTPPRPPTHSEAANDAQLIGPQPHARIPSSPPPPFVSDDEDEPASTSSRQATSSVQPGESIVDGAAACAPTGSRPSSRASTSGSASASDDENIELTEERRAWEADIRNGLSFEVRILREQQRRVARERAAALKAASEQEEAAATDGDSLDMEAETGEAAAESATVDDPSNTRSADAAVEDAAPFSEHVLPSSDVESGEGEANLESEVTAPHDVVTLPALHVSTPGTSFPLQASPAEDATVQPNSRASDIAEPAEAVVGSEGEIPSPEPLRSDALTAPATVAASASDSASATHLPSTLPVRGEQPIINDSVTSRPSSDGRLILANEPRLGLPPLSAPPTAASRTPPGTINDSATAQPTATALRRISGHRKTNSDSRSAIQPSRGSAHLGSGTRASLSGLAQRRFEGQTVRGHGSDSHLPLSRRPEDTLYVVSAPRPSTFARSSSAEDGFASQKEQAIAAMSTKQTDVEDDASSENAAIEDEDDGAESDSSIEQWLAEAAAFDALRKREEEATARLQALREPPVSDSDEDDEDEDGDATMPGAFNHRPSPNRRQANTASRKVPDPANLALMDQVLPKAPPPLVLGRSRGGAAYSDSSSETTDTDDALDQYSSSDEDDEQHRAFHEASTGDVGRTEIDPFVNSHKSVHARNTSSAPNLTILDDSEDETPTKATTADVPATVLMEAQQAPALPPRSGAIQRAGAELPRSNIPESNLSLKAKGKLPERTSVPSATQQLDARAGDFEEDTSSSRDISDAEEVLPSLGSTTSNIPVSTPIGTTSLTHRNSVSSLNLPIQTNARRTSLDPLLQPLGYGRTDLGNRLKGLFGQPLIANPPGPAPSALQAASLSASVPAAQPMPATVEARRSLSDARRASNRSVKEPVAPTTVDSRRTPEASKTADMSVLQQTSSQGDDSVSVAPSRGPTMRKQPSAGSRPTVTQSSDLDLPKTAEASLLSSSTSGLPEQRARDEALAQIAQLSASKQRQESLAALERLLAKTSRPTSMMPPSAMSRAELGGRLQLSSDVPAAESQTSAEAALTSNELPSAAAVAPATKRLSRQGAITRGNRAGVPLPSPSSALSRAPSSATRPVSFVNPRSSAAPLPRGRLPAITDATRHFPPSASSTGPGVAPSWLSYIPSEERERLPAPLEPQRVNSRAAGSRVSAMISKFETPQEQLSTSPTKQSAPFAGIARSDSNRSNISGDGVINGEEETEPAIFRRFSRNEGNDGPTKRVSQRRPPPPPPTLPKRQDTNPFRRSEALDRPISNESSAHSASMEAFARQIEQAASEWTAASLHSSADQYMSASSSRLAVPSTSSASTANAGSSGPPRSPRTLAMDSLTRREHDNGACTPPSLPPKSPLMTPEQILAAGSRNGLSASIAAAQAAAFARRDGRELRSHSASSSLDVTGGELLDQHDSRRAVGGGHGGGGAGSGGARPLPTLPASVTRPNQGLGISGSGDDVPVRRILPVPPPLPTRPPRDRDWGSVRAWQDRMDGEVSATRALPNTPMQRGETSGRLNGNDLGNHDGPSNGLVISPPTTAVSSPSNNSPANTPAAENAASNTAAAPPQVSESSTNTTTSNLSTTSRNPVPRREPSLGLTDFDLLVAQLETSGSHFESLSAIGEFLGPAKPTAATPSQLASLSVGLIECDSRRVTREGKIKQKLSCVGVRVDKCAICLVQFKEMQRAVILPCGHVFHEDCTVKLLKRVDVCPTCRAPAF
ncbi:uncharacterized protein UTRI_03925 [Ustilago trichophora]|uniref:RING-type domain-containing protein n=1 Tax=Ustilago trichophora TaxID=86804 RepID=A0A5C3EA02_9BASI|nr:uncharacterized protein UTRI_03925 [Ustilago trichophora]